MPLKLVYQRYDFTAEEMLCGGKRQMRLPNASLALVERAKITEYLLNREHPDNGGKADFFIALGFRADDWETMAAALRILAINYPVNLSVESPHGKKYIVDGAIETPVGKTPMVRTVWIIDTGETVPRLVTAYPYEE
ncbi:MAG TPA: hypothetical protein VE977_17840 [Pyrinomonadaceae bacterium]|nr:hypothetical protein [Pyrinomonadaceae bacterium]